MNLPKIAVALLIVFFNINIWAAISCQEYFSPIEVRRNITFKNQHLDILAKIEQVKSGKKIDGIMLNDRQSGIENQGKLGTCHLYAFASQFSNNLKKKYDVNLDYELAPEYWVYHHYLNRTTELLRNENSKKLQDGLGSTFGASAKLIRRIGAITKKAWREIGGKENNLSGIELQLVKNQLEKIVIESKSIEIYIKRLLQPMEIDSSLTTLKKKELLKTKLQAATARQNDPALKQLLQKLKSENSLLFQDKKIWNVLTKIAKGASITNEMTPDLYKKIDVLLSKNSVHKIEHLLAQLFFKNPETVSFENLNINIGDKVYKSPKDFTDHELPQLSFPTVALYPNKALGRQSDGKILQLPHVAKDFADFGFMMPHERFDQILMQTIDRGENIWIAYQNNSIAIDQTGIMAMEYKKTFPFASIKNKFERAIFQYDDGGHAVQIVGYIKDPKTNGLVLWIIKNSWGIAAGNNGYYYMYKSYAHNYLRYATAFDDSVQTK